MIGTVIYKKSYHSTGVCVYCQGEAVLYDHVLPLSVFKRYPYPRMWHSSVLQLVPCCYSCNAIASDRIFATFEDKQFIIAREVLERNIKRWYKSIQHIALAT